MTWQRRKNVLHQAIRIIAILFVSFGIWSKGDVAFASPPANSTNGTDTSTVLVFDTSGSMDEPDASGVVKLDAAKSAGIKLLEVIGAENQAGISSSHEVAIVEFGDSAIVNLNLTTDINAAENALRALYTAGRTAMPKGLKAALDLYPSNPTNKSFIILLSDGLPNVGLNDEDDATVVRQQVLDLSTEAGQRGICIFTVGFGDPSLGTIDETFLQQVSSNSGCGSYHNARNAWELANTYISLRHAATGTTLLEKSGNINQDQLLDIDNVQIPDNQAMLLLTLNWPGSQLDAILRDPNGVVVDLNYPGASITLTDTLASIIIPNPQSGMWNISARGVDIPGGITTYNAVLSVRANTVPPTPVPVTPEPIVVPASGGFPLAIVFIVLAAVGMMVYVMTQTQKRVTRQAASAYILPAVLVGLNGTFTGRSIPLKDGLVIGRSPACALCLYEDIVSRQHARLRYMNGRWYIQDLNSQSGVYVNGVRVQAIALNKGDRIRIGSTEFDFR
jgi:Mg-chelatase subunit ChlD